MLYRQLLGCKKTYFRYLTDIAVNILQSSGSHKLPHHITEKNMNDNANMVCPHENRSTSLPLDFFLSVSDELAIRVLSSDKNCCINFNIECLMQF